MPSLTTADYLSIIQHGLPHTTRPRDVLIIGAGMAGLAAGYELLRAGHRPLILEARNRVGGRVCTLREPFSDGLHAEAGAMRIPRSHALTMGYIEQFGLRTLPFTMSNPQGFYYLNGRHDLFAFITVHQEHQASLVFPVFFQGNDGDLREGW